MFIAGLHTAFVIEKPANSAVCWSLPFGCIVMRWDHRAGTGNHASMQPLFGIDLEDER